MSDVSPHLDIPPPKRATPKDVARRRKLFELVVRLYDQMSLLGFDAADLIRDGREGDNLASAYS
jgi:hypothetical protein